MEMVLRVEYYDDNKLKKLIKDLEEKEVAYEYIGDKQDNTIDIYGLYNYSNANRSLTFYAEFENKNGKVVYLDIKEDEIAKYSITLF